MIKYNNNTIGDWNFGDDNVKKVYVNESLCYQTFEFVAPPPAEKDYFRFISRGDGTFTFFANKANSGNTLSYSIDNGSTWTALGNGEESPSLSSGDIIMWKGSNHTINGGGIGTFSSTTNFDVVGNIMSLHYGDNFEGETDLTDKNNAFMNLFSGCTTVINASGMTLPATTLSTQCYCNMFNRASNLETPPLLTAATTLTTGCYQNMFYCYPSSNTLKTEESYFLPALTLVQNCYSQMFYGRSSVNKITCLATSGINSNGSTNNWLYNTSSTGTFTRTANVTWPTNSSGRKDWTLVNYQP